MAQAFNTTNKLHYKCISQRRADPILPLSLRDILPDTDKQVWFLHKAITDGVEVDVSPDTLANAHMEVKKMQMNKMKTTYQVCYCKEDAKGKSQSTEGVEDESFENQLLEYCKHLYGRRVQKLLPPLPSGRQLNGYIRRARLFTPLTVYQNEFGRVAYRLLEK